ncbi:MAG: thioesterase family protein [Gammaproteobacteria bacterium]|nr:thioesterase family protein [Gammaproteobacteria bacterium]
MTTLNTPLTVLEIPVPPEWVDYNGHLNVGYYNVAFDKATDALFDRLDIGIDYLTRTNNSFFTLETHVAYLQEVLEGDMLRFEAQILGCDEKRLHAFFSMYHVDGDYLSATSEQMCVHVDLGQRRTAAMAEDVMLRINALFKAQAHLPVPDGAGKSIGMKRR